MMSDYDCYREYVALKNHFTKKTYDYFKYNGKMKTSVTSFNSRKDKVFFQKLAKHPDVKNFLIANFSNNEKAWIRELAYSENAEKIYKDWLKKQQSLGYIFSQELKKFDCSFDEMFLCEKNSHPILLKKYLGKDISLETICILLNISGAFKHWNNNMKDDIIWQEIKIKIEKYTPFITIDSDKIKKICLDYFS